MLFSLFRIIAGPPYANDTENFNQIEMMILLAKQQYCDFLCAFK